MTINTHNCPCCGKPNDDDSFEYLNATGIQSRTTWVRIDLSDADISALATGCYRIAVVPTAKDSNKKKES